MDIELLRAQSFTAACNSFDLAIAIVIAVYRIRSRQALVSTVGSLTEVPILASLVYVTK